MIAIIFLKPCVLSEVHAGCIESDCPQSGDALSDRSAVCPLVYTWPLGKLVLLIVWIA